MHQLKGLPQENLFLKLKSKSNFGVFAKYLALILKIHTEK